MPFDSQGNFTRLHNWEQDRIDDIDIVTDHHDEEDDNFADGFNQCFLRSGIVPMKGNFNAGGFKLTRVQNATDDGDAVNRGQMTEAVDNLKNEITETINGSLMVGDIKCSALQADHGKWMICNGRELSREEYADLFTSGSMMSEKRLFKLTDTDGSLLAMRADVTMQICRMYVTSMTGIQRMYYALDSYEYLDDSNSARDREFAQTGVELLGDTGAEGELEVLAMAADALSASGLKNFTVELGHVGYFDGLAEDLGLSEDAARMEKLLFSACSNVTIKSIQKSFLIAPRPLSRGLSEEV